MANNLSYDATWTGTHTYTGTVAFASATVTGLTRTDFTQETATEFPWNLKDAQVWDDLSAYLPAASTNDDLGIGYNDTFGTNTIAIKSRDMDSLGATDMYCRFPNVPIPPNYVNGEALSISICLGMETNAADTTATIDVEARLHDEDGTPSADIVSTVAQTFNTTGVETINFVLTPATLTASGILDVRLKMSVNDGATGAAVVGAIYKIATSCTTKG